MVKYQDPLWLLLAIECGDQRTSMKRKTRESGNVRQLL
jgi:hypothetical protein